MDLADQKRKRGALLLSKMGRRRLLIPSAFFLAVIYYEELFLKLYCLHTLTFPGIIFTFLFTLPVAMLLGILWNLYDRECAWSLTILGTSLIALWVCRRVLNSIYLGTYVRILAAVYIVLLLVAAFLANKADKNGGRLGKLQVLTAGADPLPVYLACGLSVAALAVALFSSTIAYYAMWALAIVVFALAVYYTVKQL